MLLSDSVLLMEQRCSSEGTSICLHVSIVGLQYSINSECHADISIKEKSVPVAMVNSKCVVALVPWYLREGSWALAPLRLQAPDSKNPTFGP